jgi:membrane protease YdiL (CAAX protease family)
MSPAFLDHVLGVVLAVVLPIIAVRDHRQLQAALQAGLGDARVRAYQRIIALEWGLVAAVLVSWLLPGRSLESLGLGGLRLSLGAWVGAALTLVACGLLVLQTEMIRRSKERQDSLRHQLEPLRDMLPHDAREGRWFVLVSITAGICEELLYRGFLLAYLAAYVGTWPAVVASSIVFGFGHAYQGLAGVAKTAGLGFILAVLYVVTGSLWAPIVVHAAIDVSSGAAARIILERERTAPEN